jgi:hypothetical protein
MDCYSASFLTAGLPGAPEGGAPAVAEGLSQQALGVGGPGDAAFGGIQLPQSNPFFTQPVSQLQ